MNSTRNRTHGFTLVELMVAMVVGLLISGVAVAVFVANKNTSRVGDALARYQENFRYASYVMSRDIRMAGFFGCNAGVPPVNRATGTDSDTSFDTAVRGYENSSPASVTGRIAGTDVIKIQFSSNGGRRLSTKMAADTSDLSLTAASGDFAVNDLAVVSDCSESYVFRVTGVSGGGATPLLVSHGTTGNSSGSLKSFDLSGEVYDLITNYFYITTTADGRRVLMRRILSGTALQTEEIAEGIEDLQMLYGLDTDGDSQANEYVKADAVANWNSVSAVRICMVSRSADDGLATAPQTYYNCDGTSVTATDRRLRAPMYLTVSLRNRTF